MQGNYGDDQCSKRWYDQVGYTAESRMAGLLRGAQRWGHMLVCLGKMGSRGEHRQDGRRKHINWTLAVLG